MLKKIGIGLVVVIVGFAGFVATRPSAYRIERSQEIAAPAEVVFSFVNDLHQWPAWSPWEKLDPAMKTTYGGSAAGVGATYAWSGNDKVGEGKMTILESHSPDRVAIELDFIKPFASTATIDVRMTPAGSGVKASWAMVGNNSFVEKAFTLFMDMDAMVGKDFEKGLAQLKTVSEAEVKRRAAAAAAAAPAPTPAPVVDGSPAATQ